MRTYLNVTYTARPNLWNASLYAHVRTPWERIPPVICKAGSAGAGTAWVRQQGEIRELAKAGTAAFVTAFTVR